MPPIDHLPAALPLFRSGKTRRQEKIRYSAAYTYQLTPSVAITAQAGYTHGGGAELAFGDKYFDYSLSIAKTIMKGLVFSLTAVDTNLSAADLPSGRDDDPKVYLGMKYSFDF